MSRSLIALGVLLLVLGVFLLGIFAVSRSGDEADDVPMIGEVQGRRDETSLIWPIAAGVALAAGAACVGIGMNRWKSA